MNLAECYHSLSQHADAVLYLRKLVHNLPMQPQPGGVWLNLLNNVVVRLNAHIRADRILDWPELFTELRHALTTVTDLIEPEQWAVAQKTVLAFHAAFLDLCLELNRLDLVPQALAGIHGRKLAALVLEELDHRAEALGPDSLPARYRHIRIELRRLALGLQVITDRHAKFISDYDTRNLQSAEACLASIRQRQNEYQAKLEQFRHLRAEIAAAYPDLLGGARLLEITLEELQQPLAANTALVLLITRPKPYQFPVAVVIRNNHIQQIDLPKLDWLKELNALPQPSHELRGLRLVLGQELSPTPITLPNLNGDRATWEQRLHELLWIPLATALADVQQVHLVTHGPLHRLPYDAGCPAQFTLAVYPGLLYYHQLQDTPKFLAPQGTLLWRTYAATDIHLPPIPLVNVEAALLPKLWPNTARHIEQLGAWVDASVLHLAGHGQFDPKDPSLARLWLGPTETLDFQEILSHPPLPPVVFLSACVVGNTQDDPDGDPIGLVGALFLRGARYVIGALQPVSDLYMPLLVTLFYQEWLLKQTSPPQALAKAKRRLWDGDWFSNTENLIRQTYPPVMANWLEQLANQANNADLVKAVSNWLGMLSEWLEIVVYRGLVDDVQIQADPQFLQECNDLRQQLHDHQTRIAAINNLVDALIANRAQLPIESLILWIQCFGPAT